MKTEELLSADVTTELARLMTRKYATHVRDRTFSIIAKQEFDEVTAVVTLSNPKETFYYPVEALMNFVEQEMKPAEAALFLIDYIDLYFEEFFEEDEGLYIPID